MNYKDKYAPYGDGSAGQSDSWSSLEDDVRPEAPELTSSSSVGGGQGVDGERGRAKGWMDTIWRGRNDGRSVDVEGGSEGSQREWVPQWVRKYVETQRNSAPSRKEDSKRGKSNIPDRRVMKSMEPESAEVWRVSDEGCGPVDPRHPVAVVAEVKTMTKERCIDGHEDDLKVYMNRQRRGGYDRRDGTKRNKQFSDVMDDEMRQMEVGHAMGVDGAVGRGVRKDGVSVPAPDRFVGLNERYKRQLRTCQKDQYGVPLQNTARRFSYFASPFQVAEVCTGLGVYLVSLRAAILLAVMLSILMIYPLVENIKTQNWSDVYYLYLEPNAPEGLCTKGFELSTWIVKTSIGGYCDYGSPYTSQYGCSSTCTWNADILSTDQCNGVNITSLFSGEGFCQQHLPCAPDQKDMSAPDGPCLCCTFELTAPKMINETDVIILDDNSERLSAARFWVLFLSQIFFMGWLLMLMHFQLKLVQVQGNNIVSPSDFSVWISSIKPSSAIDSALRQWCQQFGPIMAGFNIPSVGEAIRVGHQVEDILIRKEEADADPGHFSWNPFFWVYRKFIVGNPKKLESRMEKKKLKLKIFQKQESMPTGYGLATFRYADSAALCVEKFDTSPLARFFESLTCGLTSTKPLLHGSSVKVVRAPEPSDIIWEHTECGRYEVFRRRFASWMITICVMLTGAGIQYGLASLGETLRKERYLADMTAGNGEEWAERDATIKTIRIRAVTIITGIMVVVINFCTMLTVRALAWYERWTTRTSMERWVMLKLSVSQLTNAFAAPLLAAYASRNQSGWFVRGGLIEAAFFVQCANAILPPLVHFLGIGDNFKFYVLAPFAKTQKMLNRMLAPPIFPMAEQHAASITSIGLAMFYMPVLPVSPYISLLGLVLSYFANKWIVLRRAAAPPNLNGMVTSSLNFLLRLLPLVQLILMKELYFRDYKSVVPVFYTGLAFWALFMIAPIRALLGTVKRRRRLPACAGLSYSRLLGGMRLGVGDVYSPIVPRTCSRKFKHRVAETFAQLAPAAFDSILNGEEAAAQLSLYGNRYMLEQILEEGDAAPWTPSCHGPCRVSNELKRQDARPIHSDPQMSLTGSIAAGIHDAFNLLWRPQDPDHPEDVFVRKSRSEVRVVSPENANIPGEFSYGVEDDMPIRAVYSTRPAENKKKRDRQRPNEQTDDTFSPLGSGLR